MLTFEEFAWKTVYLEGVRLSNFICESEVRKYFIKAIRRAKKEQLWTGPYGDKSEWAGMVRNWYRQYLEEAA